MKPLVLGGTAEARALAQRLIDDGIGVTSSLAGRVSRPRLPPGEVRIGGFGGVAGLVDYLRGEHITHLVDATHPFATTMSRHGVEAADAAGIPFLRYARPGWRARPDSGEWTWVASYDEARDASDRLGRRPFLTTGRQTLLHFTGPWAGREVLVRVVEPLGDDAPASWTVVLDRGPYDIAGERALMREHRVDVLLTKDSGGSYTAAKLDAAAELGVPVVVVSRPDGPAGTREVATLDEVIEWLRGSPTDG